MLRSSGALLLGMSKSTLITPKSGQSSTSTYGNYKFIGIAVRSPRPDRRKTSPDVVLIAPHHGTRFVPVFHIVNRKHGLRTIARSATCLALKDTQSHQDAYDIGRHTLEREVGCQDRLYRRAGTHF